MKSLLRRVYFDKTSPGYLAGKNQLYRVAHRVNQNVRVKDVEAFLAGENTYTQHKPLRHVFPRNKIVPGGIDSLWQADLCDMQQLRQQNGGNRYLLTVIDTLSKFCMAEPIKRKTPQQVTVAFRRILERTGRQPRKLMTDRGNEFKGDFQRFLRERGIQFYFAPNPVIKAANAERFNRTLKNRIWRHFTEHKTKRYLPVLQDIVDAINHSRNRMIGMRPVDVNDDNQWQVWVHQYGGTGASPVKFKFSEGDTVRIARWRKLFDKGYTPTFTKEEFKVIERIPRKIPVYKLEDADGDPVHGVFYAEQLQLTI